MRRLKSRQNINEQLADRALRRGAGLVIHHPVVVYLQIASTCNLDCYMCSEHKSLRINPAARTLYSMDAELFARVEEEIFPWSSRVCFGVGGEPTISSHFAEFVRRSVEMGQSVQLTTNGTRLDHGEVAEVTAHHVRALQVSIDAATASTYQRIRRGASWDRLLSGLERLNEFRNDSPADERCHLTLCFTLMRSNLHELSAFVELASELRADAVHAQHVIPVTDEGRSESLISEPERYDRARDLALDRSRSLDLSVDLPLPYGGGNGSPAQVPEAGAPSNPLADFVVPCAHPNQSIYVLHNGQVCSCCHPFAHQKMLLGNLREVPFSSIWHQRLLRNLRAGLRTGDVPAICRICSVANDPPNAHEDPAVVQEDADLAGYYGDRDLASLDGEPLGWIERTGCLEYIADLRATARTLEAERPRLLEHVGNLEEHIVNLERHIENLEGIRSQTTAHIETIERERYSLLAHARVLDDERPQLLQHLATRDAEREQLLAHVANLEHQHRGLPLVRHVLLTMFGARLIRPLDRLGRALRAERPAKDQR